jgi:hypothetical protein
MQQPAIISADNEMNSVVKMVKVLEAANLSSSAHIMIC